MSLLILSKYHKEWVSMVRTFGGGEVSEDVVQEMYLKYNDNFVQNNEPNRAYIWITLRNIFLNEIKQKERINFVDYDSINEERFTIIIKKTQQEIDSWHWYDKKLFEIYVNENMSMREIAKETNISLRSIFSTLKKCKDKLRTELENDYKKLYHE